VRVISLVEEISGFGGHVFQFSRPIPANQLDYRKSSFRHRLGVEIATEEYPGQGKQ